MNHLKTLLELVGFMKNLHMTDKQMKDLQNKKLRKLLDYAWKHSAFYRRTFEKAGITEEQLQSLPLSAFPTIDKSILMEHFDQLVTVSDLNQEQLRQFDAEEQVDRKPYQGKYHVVHSSGSTGKPGYFVYDEAAWGQMLLGIIRGALWKAAHPLHCRNGWTLRRGHGGGRRHRRRGRQADVFGYQDASFGMDPKCPHV